jgi:predicted RecA/RadA family phage recombinase
MAINATQDGEFVTVPAAANANSGAIVVVGQMFGVAIHSAVTGASLTLKLGGVFTVPKANAASMSMAAGANVYWDGAQATTSATNNTRLGVCLAAANNTVATVSVRLNSSF